jgi:hypothetical protein
MSIEGESSSGTPAEIPPSVRAQLLATEHWGLLASRSTTQSEVLTRISMFLTFTSASLVSVALVGQATRFAAEFVMLAVIVICIDVAMGLLTQGRVMNVAQEDLMYVTAMNRLRAAYVDLDPGVAPYLLVLLGAGTPAAVIVGPATGSAFLTATAVHGYRAYTDIWHRFTPLSPTPPDEG